MFENIEAKAPDAILKLIAEFAADEREQKVDLGVGVYRDGNGRTPIFAAVKKAEQYLVREQDSKAYFGSAGSSAFCEAIEKLTFGDAAGAERICTLQSPGGSGALRVAAGLLLAARADAAVWTSEPTWSNHVPLLGGAGVRLKSYPYYDVDSNSIRFEEMLAALRKAPAGDVVLLHGCCHNPTGMDLSVEQWHDVAGVIEERGLLPFVDIAYQGFASGVDEDAYPVRMLFDRVPEMIVANSCSKNFGLYRDRVGSLSLVTSDGATSTAVRSQATSIVRTMYSMPPDHGAAVVTHILNDAGLHDLWQTELDGMRARLREMRGLLVAELAAAVTDRDFSHIERGSGMFSYLGVTPEQALRMKEEFAVYVVETGRINVCGITPDNVSYIAASAAAVL